MGDVKFGFVAKDIINEGRVSEKDVLLIRNYVGTQNLSNLSDEKLIAFLLSCEKDQEATRKTILQYYSIKKKNPELFDDMNIERDDIQRQLQTFRSCVFPKRTDDGCAIIYQKFHNTNSANYEMKPAMKLFFMTLDAAIYEYPPTGLIILFDLKGFGLMHLLKTKVNLVIPLLNYLQEALPVQLKSIHIFNTGYILDKALSIFKPFMKDELFQILHFHTANVNMENFYTNFIPRKCLPEDYGGYLSSVDILHEETSSKILAMTRFFQAEEEERKKC